MGKGPIYRYDVLATDSEDTVRFSLVTAPAGMTINARTGWLRWLPADLAQVGDHSVTLRTRA